MKLDYFTLLCPEPISLSIGTIRHPTLRDIGELTFNKFMVFEMYMKLKPYDYFKTLEFGDTKFWNSLSDEEKKQLSMYDLIQHEKFARAVYLELLNFYFLERVIYRDGFLIIIDTDDYKTPSDDIVLEDMNIISVLNEKTFYEVLDILQQMCCIKNDNPMDEVKPKFKNEKARRLYERMLKAKEKENKRKAQKDFYNMSLPNIISATAAKNPGLNIINIWDATLFQLYDQFEKAQNNDAHYMNSVRFAVWGDEKNQFDPSLWYKNNYDKQV